MALDLAAMKLLSSDRPETRERVTQARGQTGVEPAGKCQSESLEHSARAIFYVLRSVLAVQVDRVGLPGSERTASRKRAIRLDARNAGALRQRGHTSSASERRLRGLRERKRGIGAREASQATLAN